MIGSGSKGMASGYSGREELGRRLNCRYGDDHDSSVASRRSNLSNSFMHRMSRNGAWGMGGDILVAVVTVVAVGTVPFSIIGMDGPTTTTVEVVVGKGMWCR